MVKVTKTVRLPVNVAERLEQEDNQSVAVETALCDMFDMEVVSQ